MHPPAPPTLTVFFTQHLVQPRGGVAKNAWGWPLPPHPHAHAADGGSGDRRAPELASKKQDTASCSGLVTPLPRRPPGLVSRHLLCYHTAGAPGRKGGNASFCRSQATTERMSSVRRETGLAPDFPQIMTVATLFRDRPEKWGLRGDPYLWADMRQRFERVECPATPEELTILIEEAFAGLTGLPISHPEPIYIEKYSHGGMSSGHVCPKFWRETALPLLRSRHPTQSPANAGGNDDE